MACQSELPRLGHGQDGGTDARAACAQQAEYEVENALQMEAMQSAYQLNQAA